jgi:hypothetical protein
MALLALVAVSSGAATRDVAVAAENGFGIYLLGTKTAMAGYVPSPGTYVTDINYFYGGSASGNAAKGIALRDIGTLTIEANVSVDANAYVNVPIALWIAPEKVLGGNVGFGVLMPGGLEEGRCWSRYPCHADAAQSHDRRAGQPIRDR